MSNDTSNPLSKLVRTSREIGILKKIGEIKIPVRKRHRTTSKDGKFRISVLVGNKHQLLKVKFGSIEKNISKYKK